MKTVLAIVILFFLLSPHPVNGEESSSSGDMPKGKEAIFSAIEKTVAEIQTISSEFRQERRLSMLKEPAISKGRFAYEKPDKLRWEFTEPEPSGFIVNGNTGKQWKGKETNGQTVDVKKNPVMRLIFEQIMAWTKADFTSIEERYVVTVGREKPVALNLVPRSSKERKYVDRITVSFDKETGYVNAVAIIEKGGDSTNIRFLNMTVNSPLEKDLFQ